MGRKSTRQEIDLSDGDRECLEGIVNNPRSLQKHVWRARIVLALGSGRGLAETMRRTGMSKPTVWRWWDRFLAEGVDGLLRDATRPPGRKPVPEDRVKAVVALAMSPPRASRKPFGSQHCQAGFISVQVESRPSNSLGQVMCLGRHVSMRLHRSRVRDVGAEALERLSAGHFDFCGRMRGRLPSTWR